MHMAGSYSSVDLVEVAIDQITPDKFDIIGAVVAFAEVLIILYWPRNV